MERISYKSITIALLVIVAVLSIAHTLITKQQFREAAFRAQTSSLSRVIQVASDETLKLVHNEAFLLANDLQSRLIDPKNHQLRDDQQLRTVLDDLFIHGFAGATYLDLVKLRVYDPELHLISQSSLGDKDLSEAAPAFCWNAPCHAKAPSASRHSVACGRPRSIHATHCCCPSVD